MSAGRRRTLGYSQTESDPSTYTDLDLVGEEPRPPRPPTPFAAMDGSDTDADRMVDPGSGTPGQRGTRRIARVGEFQLEWSLLKFKRFVEVILDRVL